MSKCYLLLLKSYVINLRRQQKTAPLFEQVHSGHWSIGHFYISYLGNGYTLYSYFASWAVGTAMCPLYTDKKRKSNFPHVEGNSEGIDCKVTYDYWTNGSLYMVEYLHISSYIRKLFLIYDIATNPIWISWYTRKMLFYFLSVHISTIQQCNLYVPKRVKERTSPFPRPLFVCKLRSRGGKWSFIPANNCFGAHYIVIL
jgi:hypothetical protein